MTQKHQLNDMFAESIGATAALYFITPEAECIFRWVDDEGLHSKFIQPTQLRIAMTGRSNHSGWIPAGVIGHGYNKDGKWFAFQVEPKVHLLQVYEDPGDLKVIKVPLPYLFITISRHSSMTCYAAKEPIKEGTPLFLAPLPNIYAGTNGSVCLGANTRPDVDYTHMRDWWNLFVESPFNGHGNTTLCKSFPNDIRELLFKLDREGATEFPMDELIPTRDVAKLPE